MLEPIALYISLVMAIFLFAYAYYEGIQIANTEGKVRGGTFVFTTTFAFVFSSFTYIFY
ncbi:hypothetical protein LS684_17050 [Cytobacillus spongiae]|jgi:hypothetical protein|uniref:hypothetical protein n=1 Tax=Cytobacillus spongiae TaxID=2901381 RepID=UPI001F1A0629|nr:hypothetical protein [Cytobacillus spongiae]UII55323.1 hypothetical protein LS684_17050 [Cytobacillus spongiae]